MAISSLPTAIPFFKNNSYYPMIIMCASRLYSMAAHNIFTHKHETPHESWLGPAIVVRIGLIVSLLAFIHLLCTHNLREAHRHTNTKSHKCVLMCCALWQVKAYRWVCLWAHLGVGWRQPNVIEWNFKRHKENHLLARLSEQKHIRAICGEWRVVCRYHVDSCFHAFRPRAPFQNQIHTKMVPTPSANKRKKLCSKKKIIWNSLKLHTFRNLCVRDVSALRPAEVNELSTITCEQGNTF